MSTVKELKIRSEKVQEYWVYQTDAGHWVRSETDRRQLWNRQSIKYLKVRHTLTNYCQFIPGTTDRCRIEMHLTGKLEYCYEYLIPRTPSMTFQDRDDGCTMTWSF
jgi:hypothetical protein